jgi:hypothetical protein
MPLRMFVRFRQQRRRLQASLIQARCVAGKPRNEHIASLGSVDADVSIRERLAFWTKLPDRLARLGNRVGADEHAKIYGALHARIPMVTPDEQRALQRENFVDDEKFWDTMSGLGAASVEEHKALIAIANKKIAEHEAGAAKARAELEAAKDRLKRLDRGEGVSGGLGKRPDLRAQLKSMVTPEQFKLIELWGEAKVTDAEFDKIIELSVEASLGAANKVDARELRRIIRTRT